MLITELKRFITIQVCSSVAVTGWFIALWPYIQDKYVTDHIGLSLIGCIILLFSQLTYFVFGVPNAARRISALLKNQKRRFDHTLDYYTDILSVATDKVTVKHKVSQSCFLCAYTNEYRRKFNANWQVITHKDYHEGVYHKFDAYHYLDRLEHEKKVRDSKDTEIIFGP